MILRFTKYLRYGPIYWKRKIVVLINYWLFIVNNDIVGKFTIVLKSTFVRRDYCYDNVEDIIFCFVPKVLKSQKPLSYFLGKKSGISFLAITIKNHRFWITFHQSKCLKGITVTDHSMNVEPSESTSTQEIGQILISDRLGYIWQS